jgi:hypothetical protein
MNAAQEAPERKPSKIIVFVIPAALTALFVVFGVPPPRTLVDGVAVGVLIYLFSLVFLLAAWHGFRFFRSFFRSGRGDGP